MMKAKTRAVAKGYILEIFLERGLRSCEDIAKNGENVRGLVEQAAADKWRTLGWTDEQGRQIASQMLG